MSVMNVRKLVWVAVVGAAAGAVLLPVGSWSSQLPVAQCHSLPIVQSTCYRQILWSLGLTFGATLAIGLLGLRLLRVRRCVLVAVFAIPMALWMAGWESHLQLPENVILGIVGWAVPMALSYALAYWLFEPVERELWKRVVFVTLGLVVAYVLPNSLLFGLR
jgi:hypothetical protein